MKGIGDLLAIISQRVFKGEEKKDRVIRVIKDVLGAEIGRDSVRFSGSTIYVETEPIVKNEIALNKTNILRVINKTAGSQYTNIG